MVTKTINILLVTCIMIKKVKSLLIMLPKTSHYVEMYDGQTKRMNFLIEDDGLLEKYSTIWDKVSSDIKKVVESLCTMKKFKNKNKISWR